MSDNDILGLYITDLCCCKRAEISGMFLREDPD